MNNGDVPFFAVFEGVLFKVCFLIRWAMELHREGLHHFCDLLDLLYLIAVGTRRRRQFLFDRSLNWDIRTITL
jgi:hypothetical protein